MVIRNLMLLTYHCSERQFQSKNDLLIKQKSTFQGGFFSIYSTNLSSGMLSLSTIRVMALFLFSIM